MIEYVILYESPDENQSMVRPSDIVYVWLGDLLKQKFGANKSLSKSMYGDH